MNLNLKHAKKLQNFFPKFYNGKDTEMPSYGCFLLVSHKSWLSIKLAFTINFGMSLYKGSWLQADLTSIKAILALMIVAWNFEVQPVYCDTFQCSPFRCIPVERHTYMAFDLKYESGKLHKHLTCNLIMVSNSFALFDNYKYRC